MVYQKYVKRVLDIVFSVLLLVATSWIFMLLMLLYLITFNLPVFFVQDRIGKNSITFRMIKFRTLKVSDEQDRRFVLGNVLRFLSLDELPQLLNVLMGDMSLIGPRPLPIEYLPLFSAEQKKRHDVRPGITGWAQVNGRNSVSWEQKFKFDVMYVQKVSFLFDAKIVVKTIILLLSFRKDTSLLEKKFTGSHDV
ncbi:MAG TPA: sugar transferase [Chryseolinea sp.]|nr:sugar transferase [Chryseolinea sp.]HPM31544.1 sugar transferase [Chryseolinea sp.]